MRCLDRSINSSEHLIAVYFDGMAVTTDLNKHLVGIQAGEKYRLNKPHVALEWSHVIAIFITIVSLFLSQQQQQQ